MLNQCTRFHSYRPQAIIRVTGEEAGAFLQGQFTNDLQQAGMRSVYGLWLNQKGRVLADSHILRVAENEFVLVGITSLAAIISQRLEAYIIADDVTLADETEKFSGLALWGAQCSARVNALLGTPPASGEILRHDDCLVFVGRRTIGENYEIIGPAPKITTLHARLRAMNCEEVGAAEAEWVRLASGIPSVPQDIGPGDLPNEGGLELAAISYTKGCYLGQEVMARLKNMGQVRRKLHVVRGDGTPPQPQDALFQGGKKIGEIRSVAGRGNEFVALAMLSLLNLNLAAGLSRGATEPAALRLSPHE